MRNRQLVFAGILVFLIAGKCTASSTGNKPYTFKDGKLFGTIFNNDCNNIIASMDSNTVTTEDYKRLVYAIIDMKPGVLAQNVGLPDPVYYPSDVATMMDKYQAEVGSKLWPENAAGQIREAKVIARLRDLGTDVLRAAIDCCRDRGVPIVASYRMNSEDWYHLTYLLSDFGRKHPEYNIGNFGNLDPAIPAVFEHRMKIFREVAEKYDIDGIEFDFLRWYHMVSDPEKNHVVLTRMVRETRQMLDEVAKKKGRNKLILGVRVGPSLNTDPNPFVYPGEYYPVNPTNGSCKTLGLDVKTWIKEGLVDYVCPSTFIGPLPSLPFTEEFVDLAKGTKVGIYPTLFNLTSWMHGVSERTITLKPEDEKALALYKYELCTTAMKMYEDGADGISTYNWWTHLKKKGSSSEGSDEVQTYIYPLLGSKKEIEIYLKKPWAIPPKP